jgi:hypothetical protein
MFHFISLLVLLALLIVIGLSGCSSEESIRLAEEPANLRYSRQYTQPWDNYEYENSRGSYDRP